MSYQIGDGTNAITLRDSSGGQIFAGSVSVNSLNPAGGDVTSVGNVIIGEEAGRANVQLTLYADDTNGEATPNISLVAGGASSPNTGRVAAVLNISSYGESFDASTIFGINTAYSGSIIHTSHFPSKPYPHPIADPSGLFIACSTPNDSRNAGHIYLGGNTANPPEMAIGKGCVGIGNTNPSFTLDITGVSPTFNLAAGAGQPYFNMAFSDPSSADFELSSDVGQLDFYSCGSTWDATWFGGAVTAANTQLIAAFSGPLILSAQNGLYLGTLRDYPDATGSPAEFALSTSRIDMTASVHIDGALNNYIAVDNRTSDSSLVAGQSGAMLTNSGATTAISYALPTSPIGANYNFAIMTDSSDLRVVAQPGMVIRSGSSVSYAGGFIDSSVVGSTLQLVLMDATNWLQTSMSGTWTLSLT